MWIVGIESPSGELSFVGDGPRVSDIDAALRFNNRRAAHYTAMSAIHGCTDAYWESERRSAEIVRKTMRGYTARALPLPFVRESVC